jgi:hypothetical protein
MRDEQDADLDLEGKRAAYLDAEFELDRRLAATAHHRRTAGLGPSNALIDRSLLRKVRHSVLSN